MLTQKDTTNQPVIPTITPEPSDEARTTIQTLPPELLLLIFEYCYEEFKLEEESQPQLESPPWHYISEGLNSSMRPTSRSDIFERFRSPTRFPFALAAVSPFWKDVLLSQPEYWTEIVCYTGSSGFFDVAGIYKRQSSLPRYLPLNFIILRERPTGTGEHSRVLQTNLDEQEKMQLDTIARYLLLNCFCQCRSISIEAHSGTSFPHIGQWHYQTDFVNKPILSSLFFTREVNDNYRGDKPTAFDSDDQVYHRYENLKSLAINGRNLDDLYPVFLSFQRNLEQLVISDYRISANGLSVADFLAILHNLPNLTRLKLQNVKFGHNPELPPASFNCDILQLHLESISPDMTSELFRLCDFDNLDSVHFTCCVLQDFPSSELLILDDLKIDHSLSFEAILGDWEGSSLWLGRCNGINDSFLDMLRQFDMWTREFRCPWMDTLYLYRLPILSLKRLKKMIKCRNRGIDYSDPHWRISTSFGPVIKKLSIDQCGIARLTEQDVEWFSSHLVEFIYIQ